MKIFRGSENESEKENEKKRVSELKTIESTWQKFELRHKYEYGTHRSVLRSYVSDFVWRKKFSGNDITYCLWSQIESSVFFHV
uniref:Uncharacterized protein n=1 Tax=Ditylenchus dipsaci TaxID=166011 RepID=A0A915DYV8_9BILA